MKRIIETIGVLMFVIGIGAGDSENLLIPIMLIATGIALYKLSERMQ